MIKEDVYNESENADGYFRIQYINGYAALSVFPPKGSGKPVHIDDVIQKMRIFQIDHINHADIEKVILGQKGEPVQLARWPEGAEFSTKLSVDISPDHMQATLQITAPQKIGDDLSVNDVIAFLKEYGISYGIDRELIHQMLSEKRYNEDVIVARGKEPKSGKGQSIEYTFNTQPGKPYLIDEYGRVNLKELNFINSVSENQTIAKILPPEKGESGINIMGEEIAAPQVAGETVKCGSNTRFIEQENRVIASINGHVFLQGGPVYVEPCITLNNVDYSTGNIRFDGSVLINGTVADGFVVEATGNIEVAQCVGNVILRSAKDIILKAGINGKNEGKIDCAGDIYTKFIESAKVIGKKNLYCEELILHSNIFIWGNVILKGKKAEICGGYSVIKGKCWCKRLGSINGVKTKISMGIAPEKMKEIEETKTDLKFKNGEMDKYKEKLKYFQQNRDEREKIGIDLDELKHYIEKINQEIKNLETVLHNTYEKLKPDKESLLIVEDTIYNGSKVLFGREFYKAPNKDAKKTVLRFVNDKIAEEGFNPADLPKISDL